MLGHVYAPIEEVDAGRAHPCLLVAHNDDGMCTVLSISTKLLDNYRLDDLVACNASAQYVTTLVCDKFWVTLAYQPNATAPSAPTPSTLWSWECRQALVHSTFLDTCLAHHVWPCARTIEIDPVARQLRVQVDLCLLRPNHFLSMPLGARPELVPRKESAGGGGLGNGVGHSFYLQRIKQVQFIQHQESKANSMLDATWSRCRGEERVYWLPATGAVLWAQTHKFWDVRGGVIVHPTVKGFPKTLLTHVVDDLMNGEEEEEEKEAEDKKSKKRTREQAGETAHEMTIIISNQHIKGWAKKARTLSRLSNNPAFRLLQLYGHHTTSVADKLPQQLENMHGIVLTTPSRWMKNKETLAATEWKRMIVDDLDDPGFIQSLSTDARTQRLWIVARTPSKRLRASSTLACMDRALRIATTLCHTPFQPGQALPDVVSQLTAPGVRFEADMPSTSTKKVKQNQQFQTLHVCQWIRPAAVAMCCVCGQSKAVMKAACMQHGLCESCLERHKKESAVACPSCGGTSSNSNSNLKEQAVALTNALPHGFNHIIVCVEDSQAVDQVAQYLFQHFAATNKKGGRDEKKRPVNVIKVPKTINVVRQAKRIQTFSESKDASILVTTTSVLKQQLPSAEHLVILCRDNKAQKLLNLLKKVQYSEMRSVEVCVD